MRKNCAKAVEYVGEKATGEHILYSVPVHVPRHRVGNTSFFHTETHRITSGLSTILYRPLHLLISSLSTFYTGLITNTINIPN